MKDITLMLESNNNQNYICQESNLIANEKVLYYHR